MGRGKKLTPQAFEKLMGAIAAGKSLCQIAQKDGWNYTSTKQMARRLASGKQPNLYKGRSGILQGPAGQAFSESLPGVSASSVSSLRRKATDDLARLGARKL